MLRPRLGREAGVQHAHGFSRPALLFLMPRRKCLQARRARAGPAARARSQSDAEHAFASVQSQPKEIGSEYGEGFVQFAMGGGPKTLLDVDTLNERLKPNGAMRMRHAMCPDEAYGMLFSWDDVVADTRGLQRRAWRRLAKEEDLRWPEVERQLYDVRPERVIIEVLQWTQDWARARELSLRVATLFVEELEQLKEVVPGVAAWLAALKSARVPCAIVSSLPTTLLKARLAFKGALDRMNISEMFNARVTAEDDCETLAQQLLSASLKLQRPPNCCVVFESSPRGIAAAHNASMKAVALQGPYKGFQLKQADLTCASLAELSIWNVRRLFALRGSESMDLAHQVPKDPPKYRRIANAVMD